MTTLSPPPHEAHGAARVEMLNFSKRFGALQAHAADLTVTLQGVRAQTGVLKLAVVDSQAGWDGQAQPVKADGAPPQGEGVNPGRFGQVGIVLEPGAEFLEAGDIVGVKQAFEFDLVTIVEGDFTLPSAGDLRALYDASRPALGR